MESEQLVLPSGTFKVYSSINGQTPSITVNNTDQGNTILRKYSFRGESSGIGSFTGTNRTFESKIEETILKSPAPVTLNETEEIVAAGHRGIWVNKQEALSWSGPVPLSQYKVNDDPNPEVIHRTFGQPIEYNQDISVRYLRPPTPPAPGELIIRQENHNVAVPAPPVVIRQYEHRAPTPTEPIIIREEPPQPPVSLSRKVITLTGQTTELPSRKVIIEKLPALPPKPPQIIIEKWLPYPKLKRKVVYEGTHTAKQYAEKQKNLVINWQAPQAVVKKAIRYLGVSTAEPNEYRARFGSSLKRSSELPHFVVDYENISKLTPDIPVNYSRDLDLDYGLNKSRVINTDNRRTITSDIELYGDLEALKLLDANTLEREGLGQYKTMYDVNKTITTTTGQNGYSYSSYSSVL